MLDFSFERSLLLCLLLNAAVFFSCWFAATRRWTTSRSQAALDAALLGYAVQYVSVGLAGMLRFLNFSSVATISLVFSAGFVAWGWRRETPIERPPLPLRDRLIGGSAGLFAVGFVLAFAHWQALLPVMSDDAMTYHFPAAVQWIQQGRIDYFQTWFFNPANTFSPLAGSTFIAWLLLPFGNDLLARFVEVPALLCSGLAIYRLSRELRVAMPVAAIVAAAAVLSRPLFTPCMMGKDDLFVVFFFLAAVVAMSHDRSVERFGPLRLGIALGLLMATKYTAMLAVPMLLPAIDGPRWNVRRWVFAATVATLVAGPWYLHNWISTGNPVFPLAIPHVFRGLFTTAASTAFHPWPRGLSVILGGQYGMPTPLAIVICVSWIAAAWAMHRFRKKSLSHPVLRLCIWGPLLGTALFFLESPFPEVRFLLPVFSLLFVCCAFAIDRWCGRKRIVSIGLATALLLLSLSTLFSRIDLTGEFSAIALVIAAILLGVSLWGGQRTFRRAILAAGFTYAFGTYAYIYWRAYCKDYLASQFAPGFGHDLVYPEQNQLWSWVDQNIPADAALAYTNLYLVYPLQGPSLRRRVVYAPTRAAVAWIADLPWLGNRLAGEAIVPAACSATAAMADRSVWLENMKKLGCRYLVIGHGGVIGAPPEERFAASLPSQFEVVFSSVAGNVYRIRPG